jgi:hypothetical protein
MYPISFNSNNFFDKLSRCIIDTLISSLKNKYSNTVQPSLYLAGFRSFALFQPAINIYILKFSIKYLKHNYIVT